MEIKGDYSNDHSLLFSVIQYGVQKLGDYASCVSFFLAAKPRPPIAKSPNIVAGSGTAETVLVTSVTNSNADAPPPKGKR